MRVHPAALIVGLFLLLSGIAVAVRGEMRARDLQHRRVDILAAIPDRARDIQGQLLNPSLNAKEREHLERELRHCEREITGIPGHFPYNARVSGYGWGIGLAAMGLLCVLYKPKVVKPSVPGATA
jgi:hypothetical protein